MELAILVFIRSLRESNFSLYSLPPGFVSADPIHVCKQQCELRTVAANTPHRYETGYRCFSLERMLRSAHALGSTLDSVLGRKLATVPEVPVPVIARKWQLQSHVWMTLEERHPKIAEAFHAGKFVVH